MAFFSRMFGSAPLASSFFARSTPLISPTGFGIGPAVPDGQTAHVGRGVERSHAGFGVDNVGVRSGVQQHRSEFVVSIDDGDHERGGAIRV